MRRALALDLLDDRYPTLHGVRVLAIVSVVQYHVTQVFSANAGVLLDGGFVESSMRVFFGMDLFFILSGFLIGSILLRSIEASGTQDLRRFYLRRVLRTFPSYYVVLTTLALVGPLTAEHRRHLPVEYLYGTNYLPLTRASVLMFWGWSLALEEQFYLCVPLLFAVLYRLRSDRARLALLGALWLAGLLVRLAIYLRQPSWEDVRLYEALYFHTHTRFDTLIAGILLAFAHRRYGEAMTGWLAAPGRRAILALSSLTCLWLLLRPGIVGAENAQLFHVLAWGTLTSLMWMPALVLLLHGDGIAQRVLGAQAFRRVATLGYGVYLVHIPIIDHAIAPLALRAQARHVSMILVWPASVALAMVLSLALGYAMHVLVERPALRLRAALTT
jgi:peptidoglycan/LPS O-acetylase OafA/YrhL